MPRFKFIIEAKVTKEVVVEIPSEEFNSNYEDVQLEQARQLAHEQFTAAAIDENDERYEETSSFSERVEDGQKFFGER